MSIPRGVLRLVARNGRPMTLRRRVGTALTTFTSVPVTGFMVSFSPSEVIGLVAQGDARITIGADVGALTAPRQRDSVLVDGKAWEVMGVHPLNQGGTAAGWRLWVRGGAA